MSQESSFQFTDDTVPRAYDEIMVPRPLEPWALLLLDDADLQRVV
jgi:hypothetical protein